jgi:hypothetical protein
VTLLEFWDTDRQHDTANTASLMARYGAGAEQLSLRQSDIEIGLRQGVILRDEFIADQCYRAGRTGRGRPLRAVTHDVYDGQAS